MSDTDSSDDSDQGHRSWIDMYLDQPFGDWFCRVTSNFASDGFNTFGLSVDPAHAKSAFSLLLGSDNVSSDSFDSDSEDEIEKCTEEIFCLIHARYIFTSDGLHEMKRKYQDGVFGRCPRYLCGGQNVLPIGLSDRPGVDTVKVYCPCCRQIYEADEAHAGIDGAFFSKSFPHYLLMVMSQGRGERGHTKDTTGGSLVLSHGRRK